MAVALLVWYSKDSRALWLVDGTPHMPWCHNTAGLFLTLQGRAIAAALLVHTVQVQWQLRNWKSRNHPWFLLHLYMAAVGFETRDLPNTTEPNCCFYWLPRTDNHASHSFALAMCRYPSMIHACMHGQAAPSTYHYPLMIHSWEGAASTIIIVYD
jgi:hypothetical protein